MYMNSFVNALRVVYYVFMKQLSNITITIYQHERGFTLLRIALYIYKLYKSAY